MVTRADAGSGLAEGTAEFLAGAPMIRRLSVLVHGKAGVIDWIAGGESFTTFCKTGLYPRPVLNGRIGSFVHESGVVFGR